jgi:DnaJ domain
VGQDEAGKRRISLDLSEDMVAWLDSLKPEYGRRSRGAIVQQLLAILRDGTDEEDSDDSEEESVAEPDAVASETHPSGPDEDGREVAGAADQPSTEQGDLAGTRAPVEAAAAAEPERQPLDDSTAIVLICSDLVSTRDSISDSSETHASESAAAGQGRGGRHAGGSAAGGRQGIQLPGFVRRQARELRRSLQVESRAAEADRGLALISDTDLSDALERVDQHWVEVYGQPPGEPVLEAVMLWLARDVWPQSDHSDGRPFSWSLAQQVVQSFAPSWSQAEATLARVITTAGVLEDPFSGATLALRVPTLINRFVQRHRSRQKRTTSFAAIDQTMTVHSALRLLQLPTIADRPYTFKEIREAYREQAQNHHPDAGGSAEAMRRLNEAYQFLKERYRRAS